MIIELLMKQNPNLKIKLLQAGIKKKPYDFIKQNLVVSFYTATAFFFILLSLAKSFEIHFSVFFYAGSFIALFLLSFNYFMKIPDVIMRRKEHEIAREIIFAGRFLIVELESGVPIYNAMINVAENFDVIGKYFKEIIDKINMGTTMEEAITEVIETTPSNNFRKLLWQLLNSLKTGADVSTSLNSVVEQITHEQMIEVKEYGRKLNPLAMFYMMMAVIIPTLGVTLLIVISTFLGINISLSSLLSLLLFLGFVQFMFLAIIKSSRPAVEL